MTITSCEKYFPKMIMPYYKEVISKGRLQSSNHYFSGDILVFWESNHHNCSRQKKLLAFFEVWPVIFRETVRASPYALAFRRCGFLPGRICRVGWDFFWMSGRSLKVSCGEIFHHARWALPPCKCPYKWVTGVVTVLPCL